MIHRIEHGQGRPDDLDLLTSVGNNMAGRTICALAMPLSAGPQLHQTFPP